jgi:transcription antitermination factor NusG
MTRGTMVTINFGPFVGLNGEVISTSRGRTTVRIMLKGRVVLVELDTNMIRVPVRHGTQPPLQRTRPV